MGLIHADIWIANAGDNECLLGAIPMAEMEVRIDPQAPKLIVNPAHPYKPQLSLK